MNAGKHCRVAGKHAFFVSHILRSPFGSICAIVGKGRQFDGFFGLLRNSPIIFRVLSRRGSVRPVFSRVIRAGSSNVNPMIASFGGCDCAILIPAGRTVSRTFTASPGLCA